MTVGYVFSIYKVHQELSNVVVIINSFKERVPGKILHHQTGQCRSAISSRMWLMGHPSQKDASEAYPNRQPVIATN